VSKALGTYFDQRVVTIPANPGRQPGVEEPRRG